MDLKQSFLTAVDRDEISKPLDFVSWYESDLIRLRNENLTIVEVGVYRGHFLAALEKWMPNARLIGIDLCDFRTVTLKHASFYLADQTNAAAIDAVFEQAAPKGADVIIDDASHLGKSSLALFNATFDRWLRPHGSYYIEDWGTGYWQEWTDGAAYNGPSISANRIISHDSGMVGFIKSLIDDVAAGDRQPPQPFRIASMLVRPGLVKLEKVG